MADRSFHFVPGSRPDLFERLETLGADRYVLDLEDAVPLALKQRAREDVARFLRTAGGDACFVRVNPCQTPEGVADMAALAGLPGVGLVVSKIDSEPTLEAALAAAGTGPRPIVALVESFAGIRRLPAMLERHAGRLHGVAVGVEDLLATSCFDEQELAALVAHAKCAVATECLAHGLLPIDGICTDTVDAAAIEAHAVRGRATGMAAKFTIHPRQIPVVNAVFGPSAERVRWAEEIVWLAGSAADTGYVRMGDVLVTPPKVKKARHIKAAGGFRG
jgi:citrate lyase subunit beta/citryl-CoA lyase